MFLPSKPSDWRRSVAVTGTAGSHSETGIEYLTKVDSLPVPLLDIVFFSLYRGFGKRFWLKWWARFSSTRTLMLKTLVSTLALFVTTTTIPLPNNSIDMYLSQATDMRFWIEFLFWLLWLIKNWPRVKFSSARLPAFNFNGFLYSVPLPSSSSSSSSFTSPEPDPDFSSA